MASLRHFALAVTLSSVSALKCFMYADQKHVKAWSPEWTEEQALKAYYPDDAAKRVPLLQDCPSIRVSANSSLSAGMVCMNQVILRVTAKASCMNRQTAKIPSIVGRDSTLTDEYCTGTGTEYIRTSVQKKRMHAFSCEWYD